MPTATKNGVVGKLFHQTYNGVVIFRPESMLGLQIEGGEIFTSRYAAKRSTQSVSLILMEGVIACLAGDFRYASYQGDMVWYELDQRAYDRSGHVQMTGGRTVGGFYRKHPDGPVFYTNIQSTSQSTPQNLPNGKRAGKTEMSIVGGMFLEAVRVYETSQDPTEKAGAKHLLERYHDAAQLLAAEGELPLTGTSQAATNRDFASGTPKGDALKQDLRELSEAFYQRLVYNNDVSSGQTFDWKAEHQPLTLVPGWTQGAFDACKLMTDERLLDAFIQTGNSRALAASQPASSPPAAQPASQSAPSPRPAQAKKSQKKSQSATGAVQAAQAATEAIYSARGQETLIGKWKRRAMLIFGNKGGIMNMMLPGPAGTGKTHAATMPVWEEPIVVASAAADSNTKSFIGGIVKGESGDWINGLGVYAAVTRFAMLYSIIVAMMRGARPITEATAFGTSGSGFQIWNLLAKLQDDPEDRALRAELDQFAQPYYPESWKPVHEAYKRVNGPFVGSVVTFFYDEALTALSHLGIYNLLLLALDEKRRLRMKDAGYSWRNLYCGNVMTVLAGNLDEATKRGEEVGRALRSRLNFTFAVGYPEAADEIKRLECYYGINASRPNFVDNDEDQLELASATYLPPPPLPVTPLTSDQMAACVDLATWQREEYQQSRAYEIMDGRAVMQLAATFQALLALGECGSPAEAFVESVEPMVDRLVAFDDLGLPVKEERERLLQRAAYVANKYSL